jgi:hypothetical protein
MNRRTLSPTLPPLSDEAASQIHHWLIEFLYLFEARYFCQLRHLTDGPPPPFPFKQAAEPAEPSEDSDHFNDFEDDYIY